LIERLDPPPHPARRSATHDKTRLRPDQEAVLFLARWLKAPHRMGAVVPSGRVLARAMAREIDPVGGGTVIELGGGTGSITRALLERGVAPRRLVVVERDRMLAALLRKRFPGVKVVRGDACLLVALLRPLGIESADAVVSSLPLLSMPKPVRRRIVEESFAFLGEDGPFVQFTYGVASPLAAPELRLAGEVADRVWANLPPAAVWRFRRLAAPKTQVA
jgi:phosphatidylethanolamine/phosphatidyl-N-methylethanolamine N-methyltransferase